MKRAMQLAQQYNIQSVPTVIVDGKFVTSSDRVGTHAQLPARDRRAGRQGARRAAEGLSATDRGRRRARAHRRTSSSPARRRASARRWRAITRRRARRSACSRGVKPSSRALQRPSRPRRSSTYAGDVRDAAALARCRTRFHRAFRRTRYRHRQRRRVARHADRPSGRPAGIPRRCSRRTSSASSTRSSRSSRAMRAARHGALVGIASDRGLPRHSGIGRLQRVEGRGHRLSREPARRAARQRCCRRHDLPGVRRDADDGRQPLSDAVPDACRTSPRARSRARSRARKRFYVLPWQMAIAGARAARCCRGRSSTGCSSTRRSSRAAPIDATLARPSRSGMRTPTSERNANADCHAVAVAVTSA